MTLSRGSRLGPYEVVALIGKGGMGEVYQVRDTRLGRSVAIKVLSTEFTSDLDRVKRFEREARMLAALNHPHIATIHGVEDAEGVVALVMELVDGETLADQIARAPVPVATALRLAGQVADALDAAHEKGIVHRDLKPSNIKITSTGVVKVLDFGLAKDGAGGVPPLDEANGASDAGQMTAVATIEETLPGRLLGTPAYMSPEQARGYVVDKRADIWAFGCVLFEMLTGRSPFARSTITDTIAAVLEHEPAWAALPGDAPAGVLRLLRKCLEKDPRRRLRDLGDWELAIEPTGHVPSPAKHWQWIPWVALAACLGLGGVLFVGRDAPVTVAPPPTVRFDVPAAVALSESGQFSVSPDGRHLVFAGTGDDRILRLWIKSFDAPDVRPLPGTEAEVVPVIPPMFWSPDSQFIAFYADGKIKKVSRSGGVPDVVCEVPGTAVGGSWNRQDVLIVGNATGGLLRCNARGGAASPLTANSGPQKADHLMPSFLPDGRHFIYLRVSRANPSRNGLYLGDLELAPDKQPDERLVETGFGGAYVPAGGGDAGYVLFVRDSALLALPFDAGQRAITGDPLTIANSVGAFLDTAFFTASPTTVVYRGVTSDFQLTWLDRQGQVLGRMGDPGPFSRLALSPDGTRAVVVRENRQNRADQDLWMVDLVRNTTTRFTADPSFESAPVWSADGTEVWYTTGTGVGAIHRKLANGTRAAEVVLRSSKYPPINPATSTLGLAASPAGNVLTFTVASPSGTKDDLWILTHRPGAKPAPLIEQDFDQIDGQISPDGRWIAYVSNESGSNEIFVRALTGGIDAPTLGAGVVVSRGGGKSPRWRADSRELLYQTLSGTIMAASIAAGSVGAPSELARVPGTLSDWGVSSDGQRLLVAVPTKGTASPPFTVVLNWQTSLK